MGHGSERVVPRYDPKTSVTVQSGDYAMEEERTDGRKRTICHTGRDGPFHDQRAMPGHLPTAARPQHAGEHADLHRGEHPPPSGSPRQDAPGILKVREEGLIQGLKKAAQATIVIGK